jgi:regulator of protease activity HflC (stomatin/prohibitin superfamily)
MRLVLCVLIGVVVAGCGIVDPGERATFSVWGRMDQKCYEPGFYTYNPFSTNMDEINIQTQRYEVKKLTAATQDLQEIHADITVNYALDSTQCHKLMTEIGHDFESKVIVPAVADTLKAATAHFPIDRVVKERHKLATEIFDDLRNRLSLYYIRVEKINLTDFGFSQAFSQAVERKQIEEQRVQEAEFRRQQAVKNAEAAVALADGQAKANKLLAESLKQSPETIEFRRLEVREKEIAKWNGVLPGTVMGQAPIPILNIK